MSRSHEPSYASSKARTGDRCPREACSSRPDDAKCDGSTSTNAQDMARDNRRFAGRGGYKSLTIEAGSPRRARAKGSMRWIPTMHVAD